MTTLLFPHIGDATLPVSGMLTHGFFRVYQDGEPKKAIPAIRQTWSADLIKFVFQRSVACYGVPRRSFSFVDESGAVIDCEWVKVSK